MTEYYRSTSDLRDEVIRIPALLRPTRQEFCKKYSWICEREGILSDVSPECEVILDLGTLLAEGEEWIDGDGYALRSASLTNLLGYQQLKWLVAHQDEYPRFRALLGKIYIDALGITVMGKWGYRRFPCLGRNGGRWYLRWRWTGRGLYRRGRLACARM